MGLYDKPEVAKKFKNFYTGVKKNNGKMGHYLRAVHFNYNNTCNFKCEFCYTKSPIEPNPNIELPLDKIAEFADQAHKLGYYEFDLQGGELLINPEKLFKLLQTIKTERFFTIMTTNGYFLTQEIAHKLKKLGMDRLSISITGLDEELHDNFMKKKDAHKKALEAMEFAKKQNFWLCQPLQLGTTMLNRMN